MDWAGKYWHPPNWWFWKGFLFKARLETWFSNWKRISILNVFPKLSQFVEKANLLYILQTHLLSSTVCPNGNEICEATFTIGTKCPWSHLEGQGQDLLLVSEVLCDSEDVGRKQNVLADLSLVLPPHLTGVWKADCPGCVLRRTACFSKFLWLCWFSLWGFS